MLINSYVVSLENQIARRKHIQQIFGKLGIKFEFFDAIDVANIKQIQSKYNLFIDSSNLSDGEIACYLSHYLLWNKVKDSNREYMAIFEDDIHLAEDSFQLLSNINWLPKDFDVIKLETMFERVLIHKGLKLNDYRHLSSIQSRHMGCAGYIVSHKGALKLINETNEKGVSKPVDHLVFDWLIADSNHIYQINPAICVQDNILNKTPEFKSSIEKNRVRKPKPTKLNGINKFKRELKRLKFQLSSNTLFVAFTMYLKGFRKEIIKYRP